MIETTKTTTRKTNSTNKQASQTPTKRGRKPKSLNGINEKLSETIKAVKNDKENVIVLDDGRTYTKVQTRIEHVRRIFGFDIKIISVIRELTPSYAHAEAQLYINRDGQWELVQTGNAFEEKHVSPINNTSYVEVAETSAIGRCLAFMGISGDEFASVDEMVAVINNKGSENKKSNVVKKTGTSKNKVEQISEDMIKYLEETIRTDDDITLEMIISDRTTSDGKRVTKIQDLTQEDAVEIKKLIEASKIDSPL